MSQTYSSVDKYETPISIITELENCYNTSKNLEIYLSNSHLVMSKLVTVNNLYLILLNETSDELKWHFISDYLKLERRFSTDQYLMSALNDSINKVLNNKKVLNLTIEKNKDSSRKFQKQNFCQLLALPLLDKQERSIGVLLAVNADSGCTPKKDDEKREQERVDLITIYSHMLADAIAIFEKSSQISEEVRLKTHALRKDIEQVIKSEKLKHALFDITALSHQQLDCKRLTNHILSNLMQHPLH